MDEAGSDKTQGAAEKLDSPDTLLSGGGLSGGTYLPGTLPPGAPLLTSLAQQAQAPRSTAMDVFPPRSFVSRQVCQVSELVSG